MTIKDEKNMLFKDTFSSKSNILEKKLLMNLNSMIKIHVLRNTTFINVILKTNKLIK